MEGVHKTVSILMARLDANAVTVSSFLKIRKNAYVSAFIF